ncbi:MAG: FAD binding domain-containing protein [Dehalococcoidia bacterium]
MLRSFHVLDPSTVLEAAKELGRLGDRAKVYAGGAELLLLLRHGLLQADWLIDIKRISGLDEIAWDGGVVRIGATVTHHRLEENPLIRKYLSMFATTESQVANIRVRNQGTLGGNFCFNDPHSDPATALLVYGAGVKVVGERGERQMALKDFLVDMYTTALSQDEILVEVQVPPLPPGFGSAYLSVHRFQRPTLGVAAAVRMQHGQLDDVRLAVGCVGPIPERIGKLEDKIRGLKLEGAQRVIGESEAYLTELLQPVDDLLGSAEYKLYMTRVLLSRALSQSLRGNGSRYDD